MGIMTELSPELLRIQEETWQKIHDIEAIMLRADPNLPGHLAAIHRNLSRYEELNHLLTDDQIHKLMKGQSQVTGTVIVATVAKSTKSSNTRLAKSIAASDL